MVQTNSLRWIVQKVSKIFNEPFLPVGIGQEQSPGYRTSENGPNVIGTLRSGKST